MAKKSFIDRFSDAYEKDDLGSVQTALNSEILTPLVRSSLNDPQAEVDTWQCQALKRGIGGSQLFKISGTIPDDTRRHNWSLVLKVLRKETAVQGLSEDEWQREALAYRSGLLDSLPGGLEAATCYALENRSESEIWMWLEDLSGVPDASWSVDRYVLAARHLGQLSGYYLSSPLPDHPWLVRSYERQVIKRDGNIENYRQHKDHPLIRRMIPAEKDALVFNVWDRREEILDKLFEHLPQTFGHMDAFRGNLFSRPSPDLEDEPATVAIDWAFTGINPIGTELKILVVHSTASFAISADHIADLDQLAFGGYVDGLHETGWEGDPRQVRYAYAMIAAISLLRHLSFSNMYAEEDKHATLENIIGRPIEEIFEMGSKLYPYLLDLVEEGFALDKELF